MDNQFFQNILTQVRRHISIRLSFLSCALIGAYLIYKSRERFNNKIFDRKVPRRNSLIKKKISVEFAREIIALFPHLYPTFFGRETFYVFSLFVANYVKSNLTIIFSDLSGDVTRAIVDQNQKFFLLKLTQMGLLSLPSAGCVAFISWCSNKIATVLRENLTNYLHEMYFLNNNYYTYIPK